MRRSFMSAGVCLAIFSLAACSASTEESLFTLDQARSIGITTEADASALDALYDDESQYTADGVEVSEYIAAILGGGETTIDPAKCADLAVPLALPSMEADSADHVFAFGALLFVKDGQGDYVNQSLRHFKSIDAAKKFVNAYREAFAGCSSFRFAAEAGPVEVKTSVGSLPFEGEGFEVSETHQAAGQDDRSIKTFVMRQGNVIAFVSGAGDTAKKTAAMMSKRLNGKFEATESENGTAQAAKQSATEACDQLAEVGPIDAQAVLDGYFGQNGEDLDLLTGEWDTALGGVTENGAKEAATAVSTALHDMIDYRGDSSGYTEELETIYLSAVGQAVIDLSRVDPSCMTGVGEGWTSDSPEE
jgi:hypothetical protein